MVIGNSAVQIRTQALFSRMKKNYINYDNGGNWLYDVSSDSLPLAGDF